MIGLSGLLAVVAVASQISSASYSIEKWSMDSGGLSAARSSSYTASMTLGQADASGGLRSESYTLTGGFWSFSAPAEPLPDEMFKDSFEDIVILHINDTSQEKK